VTDVMTEVQLVICLCWVELSWVIRRWRLLLSTHFNYTSLFITLHDPCEDSLMHCGDCVLAWPSAAINTITRYKRRPTLGVINLLDDRHLLTTLDTSPVLQSVVHRIISAQI